MTRRIGGVVWHRMTLGGNAHSSIRDGKVAVDSLGDGY